jgi:rhamnopyranosyl-N-acetylglucosaminyl-diphospho-decaprenol beta-1,3/1,4-galactofuranosyltransferase
VAVLNNPKRVVAVVVAYNRRDLLVEAMNALAGQTHKLDAIVVIDNASDDGSGEAALKALPSIDVVRLEKNTGGAGGFAAGIAHALAVHEPDWVWLMDDDTIPTPTAIEELLSGATSIPGVTVAGSRVVWHDGQEHPMNTPRENPFASEARKKQARDLGLLDVRSSSFVSMLISVPRIREVGLPVADYFIWNDDFEYSVRLIRGHRGVFVPSSVVVHKTKVLGSTDADPGARFFFEVRNKVWLMRHSSGLSLWEKFVYSASTLRRWRKTVATSNEPEVLIRERKRGWNDGWRTNPRSTSEVLAGLGAVSDEVSALELAARKRT